MVKKTKGKSDAEKQEAERRETALRGKDLSSEQTGSGTQRLLDNKPWLQRIQKSRRGGQEKV